MGSWPFTTTLVFVISALGTVLARWGSRPRPTERAVVRCWRAPLLVAAASTVLFLLARDVKTLLVARFLCGLAAGVSLPPRPLHWRTRRRAPRASVVSTAANTGGLGLGSVIAGLFAQFSGDPTYLVFWFYLVALFPALVAVAPETVAARHRLALSVRSPTVPDAPADRGEFLRGAAAAFAALAVNGLFFSLVPSFLPEQLHVHDVAAIAGEVGLLFIVALIAQVATPARWLSRRWLTLGFLVGGVGYSRRTLDTVISDVHRRDAPGGQRFRAGVPPRCRGHSTPLPIGNAGPIYSRPTSSPRTPAIVPTLALGPLDQAINQDIATSFLAIGVVAVTLAAILRRRPSATTDRTGQTDQR